jgi:hypothetical protein
LAPSEYSSCIAVDLTLWIQNVWETPVSLCRAKTLVPGGPT